ncbi:hypothetical protein MGYG_07899 [Nannizzia gypsea CBS 118893]|uniref:Uncharacterized protein n=1 Tax=Arthroderma gypseum (strain ATCC MYA-4604 / CBS 118893) TaxID=535722 RepID=E4V4H3_ARTGP|nr:hypothetical protein MGYG_07899 [Nannizzia gypsea CBS 118893]EFR04897.1 hypothetical protein MGYG_07899 [Nannizzia gypsea CBS 118893]
MFRQPRQTQPDRFSMRLGTVLHPLTVIPWGPLALSYLGVPIGVGATMIVLQDHDYTSAIQKLENTGFTRSVLNRNLAPEIIEDHPTPQQMLEEINAGYKRVDRLCAVFDYPCGDPAEKGLQRYSQNKQYDTYSNLHYPLEPILVESFVKAAIDEETDAGFSAWGELLKCWVSMITAYLEVDNNILDYCLDKQAVGWYSVRFGRIHEAKFGPMDRRISKRLGSGKELPMI